MPPTTLTALRRGWSKRCPHCGQGPLFTRWAEHVPSCPHCGLVYERNSGDTWAFTIVGDRIPIAALIAAIYFGVARTHPIIGAVLFVLAGLAIAVTAPNRWGIGIALHYLSRLHFPDPDDPIPDEKPGGRAP